MCISVCKNCIKTDSYNTQKCESIHLETAQEFNSLVIWNFIESLSVYTVEEDQVDNQIKWEETDWIRNESWACVTVLTSVCCSRSDCPGFLSQLTSDYSIGMPNKQATVSAKHTYSLTLGKSRKTLGLKTWCIFFLKLSLRCYMRCIKLNIMWVCMINLNSQEVITMEEWEI